MAGVVVVATFAVAIPALASGHGRTAVHAVAAPTLLCPGPIAPGSTRLFVVPTTHTKSRRRGRHTSKGAPAIGCFPPCGWIVTEPGGATERVPLTPPLTCEPRLVCVLPGADRARVFCHPIPCILRYARGSRSATGAATAAGARFLCTPIPCPSPSLKTPSGATGAIVLCPPLPCRISYLKAPGSAAPATRVAILCRPFPCPVPNATTRGSATGATGATGAIVCPPPPLCPPAGTSGASACPAPCIDAGVSVPTGTIGTTPTCPPIPICPPTPRTTAASELPALYACPQIAAGAATGG